MKHVLVERVFPEPTDLAEVTRALEEHRHCYDALRVRHLRTCLSLDGRRMICEYEAPDAESVRQVSERAGVPYERVWTAQVFESKRPDAT